MTALIRKQTIMLCSEGAHGFKYAASDQTRLTLVSNYHTFSQQAGADSQKGEFPVLIIGPLAKFDLEVATPTIDP